MPPPVLSETENQLPSDAKSGTGGGTRTPDRRFWRPLLFQLSYTRARAQYIEHADADPSSARA